MKKMICILTLLASSFAHAEIIDSDSVGDLPEGTVLQFSNMYIDIKPHAPDDQTGESVPMFATSDGWTCSVQLSSKSLDDRILRDFKFVLGDIPDIVTQTCQYVQWSEKCQPIPPIVEIRFGYHGTFDKAISTFSCRFQGKIAGEPLPVTTVGWFRNLVQATNGRMQIPPSRPLEGHL